jgi:hypothetical protein
MCIECVKKWHIGKQGYTFNCAIGIENMGTWPLKEKFNKNKKKRKKGQNHSTPPVIDLKHFYNSRLVWPMLLAQV